MADFRLSCPPIFNFGTQKSTHPKNLLFYRCVASNTVGKIVSRDVRVNAVVLQNHELHVDASKDVQIGASAMLRCNTPGFVRDFISVTSWIQDSTFNIYPSPRGGEWFNRLIFTTAEPSTGARCIGGFFFGGVWFSYSYLKVYE
jgi:hypothetical protein